MTEKKTGNVTRDGSGHSRKSDTDAILDAVKELTTQVAELTKTVGQMKATHDKWVRAGKF